MIAAFLSSSGIVALVSGLTGALATAALSYFVRRKAHAREEEERRKALAHVHFVQLTDFVAQNEFLAAVVGKLAALAPDKFKTADLSHALSIALAKWVSENPEFKKRIAIFLGSLVTMLSESSRLLLMTPREMVELKSDTVYFYNRYMQSALAFRINLDQLNSTLLAPDSELSPDAVNSVMVAYRRHGADSKVLRTALSRAAGVTSNYSNACFSRSFEAAREIVVSFLQDSLNLGKAVEAIKTVQPSTEDAPSGPV